MNEKLIEEINSMLDVFSEEEIHQVHAYVVTLYKSKNRSEKTGLEKDQQPDQT